MKTTTARQHRPGSEETVVGSLRELLRGLIDYAGLFPPARLDMAATVDRYARGLRGSEAWMVGRIIIPAGRLDEFEEHAGALFPRDAAAEPWRVSALTAPAGADGLAGDLERIVTFNEGHEDPSAGLAVIDVIELTAAAPSQIETALGRIPDELFPFFELPIDDDPRGLVAALAGSDAGAKVRTGGLTAESFPAAGDLSRFILACAAADTPFKATAGLHHPVRQHHESVQTRMYGFFNVFVAACLVHASVLDEPAAAALLEEEAPESFVFGDDELAWRGHRLRRAGIEKAREHFAISFGSCSFDEPREDLRRLKLL